MKKIKKLLVILSTAVVTCLLCLLAACGNGYISGTFKMEVTNDDIASSDSDGMFLATVLATGTPHGSVELVLNDDGTYKYTKTIISYDSETFVNMGYTNPFKFEFAYTGNYSKGKVASTFDLKFPTDCEWKYDYGALHGMVIKGDNRTGTGKYSDGKTEVVINTAFSENASTYEVMSLFQTEFVAVSEIPQDTSSFAMTVTVNTETNALSF